MGASFRHLIGLMNFGNAKCTFQNDFLSGSPNGTWPGNFSNEMLRSVGKKNQPSISERGPKWGPFPGLLKVAKAIIPETLGRKGGPFWDPIFNRFLLLK